MSDLKEMGKKGKQAASAMAQATSLQKNIVLENIASLLIQEQEVLLKENSLDISAAQAKGLSAAMVDRLTLSGRLEGIAEDIRKVIDLPDPIREEFDQHTLANGLNLCKRRTPIGVLGVIYEARPNVTIDVAALTIKTGNCAILRGGSETLHSNKALLKIIHRALNQSGLPTSAIQLIADADRRPVLELLKMHDYVDLIIPRGGAHLHQFCRENSLIPVITGGIGICHLFVDQSAHLAKALPVICNAKIQRPTVCNALDTLIVHAAVANEFIPSVVNELEDKGVICHLDDKAIKYLPKETCKHAIAAEPKDWETEWLSLDLGIKVVEDIEGAIAHIKQYSSGHSDGILTENISHANRFIDEIDSAAVYINASTRFTDGSQFGLGAEAAISTQKLHARGPMGLKELTSYKWVVKGNYHIRK